MPSDLIKYAGIAATATFALLWMAINTLLAAASAALGSVLLHSRFLCKLLNIWGGTSPLGLQLLVEKLQVLSVGSIIAPAQMPQFRGLSSSLSWSTLAWSREYGSSSFHAPPAMMCQNDVQRMQ